METNGKFWMLGCVNRKLLPLALTGVCVLEGICFAYQIFCSRLVVTLNIVLSIMIYYSTNILWYIKQISNVMHEFMHEL